MKIKAVLQIREDGKIYQPGEVADIADERARDFIIIGRAVEYVEPAPAAPAAAPEVKQP